MLLYSVLYTCWQAKALVEPIDCNEYIEKRKREKLDKEFAGQRITVRHFLPKLLLVYLNFVYMVQLSVLIN